MPSAPSSFSKDLPTRCVECGAPLESPIGCFDCHAIFPPRSPLSHFDRLGLPTTFAVDLGLLEERYLKWSREFHPDYFQLRSPDDQQLSLSLSSSLNDAYATLADPFRRAEYLLALWGGPSASAHRAMPDGFLESVLELRMEIEEAKEDPSLRTSLGQRLRADREAAMARVAVLMNRPDQRPPDPPTLLEIRQSLNTVKYFDGLLRDLDSLATPH